LNYHKMKSILSILLVSALLFCASHAIEVEDEVFVLTKDNFDTFINDEGISLVEFYAPWCGHCKKLTPEYAKAAATLKDNEPVVRLGKVDATVEPDLASRYGVTGYPTLKVFRGGEPTDYKGPRDASGITSYMKKQAAPSITTIKSIADLEKFIAEEAGVVYFGDATHALSKTFEKNAEKLREKFRFAKAESAEVLEKIGHKNEVVLFQSKRYSQSPLESIKAVFAEGAAEFSDFVHDNILPLVGEVDPDNQALYHSRNKPLLKLYTDLDWKLNAKGANYILNRIRKIAGEYKDKLSFAVASKTKHAKEFEDSGLTGDLAFSIHDLAKGHKYPGLSAFTPESIRKHIDDFLSEKLEPYLKSEAIPTQVDGEPTVVVGKTFDSIVKDPTKDVLIEIYAPWCGHCKSLEPKYKELASKMAQNSDTVVIAKIDGTANDIPPQYTAKGYPTIFFAPANNKDKPMTYDGPREVKDFENYIKRNANLPLSKKSTAPPVTSKDEL